MRRVAVTAWLAACAAVSFGAPADGAILCPGLGGNGVRVFQLEAAGATCWDYGAGNVPNKDQGPNQDVFYGTPTFDDGKLQLPTGLVFLDKSDSGGDPLEGVLSGSYNLQAGRSGTFSIAGSPSTSHLIIFKTGVAALNPDWAAFLLPAGTLSGSWSFNGQQSLSHVVLYGGQADALAAVVPIPAAAWLLGSGLLGLLAVGRRRRKSTIASA